LSVDATGTERKDVRMGVRRISLLAALTAALVGAATGVASGVFLDKGTDKGATPLAYASGEAIAPAKLFARVTAKPKARIDVDYDTNCSVGAKGKVRQVVLSKKAPFRLQLKKGFKRPDECLVDFLAAYEDGDISGTIKIELTAK
jgi:hypothetical protein